MSYCQNCGTELVLKQLENEGTIPYCPYCKEFRFPLYNVAVSMIVINKQTNKILLIKQYQKPDYILVAGYVNKGENLENAVKREIKEETGMNVQELKFNRSEYYERTNTLMCNYSVFVENDDELNPNKEIDSYQWFSYEEAKKNIKEKSLASYFLNEAQIF